MANYATLKAAIQQVIKQNGNNEITGAILQSSLLAMVNSLGAGYQYAGIAIPSTNPGTPDENVFYFASQAGTYSNMGGFVLNTGDFAIIKYNGTWSIDFTGMATTQAVHDGTNDIYLQYFGKFNQDGNLLSGANIISGNLTFKKNRTYRFRGTVNQSAPYTDYMYLYDENGTLIGSAHGIISAGQTTGYFDWTPTQDYSNVRIEWQSNTSANRLYNIEVSSINFGGTDAYLSELFQYMGIATPTTNPGSSLDHNMWYLAMTDGVYTNFNSIKLVKGETAILKYNGTTWVKDSTNIINDNMRDDGASLAALNYVKNNYYCVDSVKTIFRNLTLKPGITYTLIGTFDEAITDYTCYYAVYDANGNVIVGPNAYVSKNSTTGTRTFTVSQQYVGAYINCLYNSSGPNYLAAELQQSVPVDPSGVELEITIPSVVYAVVGTELNLWNDAISFSADRGLASPLNYQVVWTCNRGLITDRCFRYNPAAADAGNTFNCTCSLYSISGALLKTKTFQIKVLSKSALASAKRIVFFGDSLGATTASSLYVVFHDATRFTGTPPTMLGTRGDEVKYEAVGGYTWADYATAGTYAYRVSVSGVSSVGLGAQYSIVINGSTVQLTVREVNITGGTGNILLEAAYGAQVANFPATGTLTKVSGTGDASISFTNGFQESGNPLWNSNTNQLDIALYRTRLGLTSAQKLDAVAFQFGLNDAYNVANVTSYIQALYNAFIADNPNCLFIVGLPPISGNDFNGAGDNYGASTNPIAHNIKMFNFRKLYNSLVGSGMPNLRISTAGMGVDRWFGYPFGTREISQRYTTTEQYHDNYVHPATSGYRQLGDGYFAAFVSSLTE